MLLIWSGVGLLIPAIAVICSFGTAMVLGHSVPDNAINFISALTTAIVLAAAGLELRRREIRRHLYWIPMEYWAIGAGIFAMTCIPKFFSA
ncbi:MAG: hypothetical protein U0103_25995 [Candidatus Obscuribacterales bacterium]|nr:hypothetical protein [Cyanobacteria bacterium SZAS LIN-5]RTL36091.1 MAG: hypothetical protein EKK48_27445 [Candidatus Melainabacteria bacterium]